MSIFIIPDSVPNWPILLLTFRPKYVAVNYDASRKTKIYYSEEHTNLSPKIIAKPFFYYFNV